MDNENKENQTIYTPIIIDNNVVKLKINNREITLKNKLPIQIFTTTILPLLNELNKYFELEIFSMNENVSEWRDDEINDFLIQLPESQVEIIKFIVQHQKISREDLAKKLSDKGILENSQEINKKLAGIVAGLSRKINNLGKEQIFNISHNFYYINTKLSQKISSILKLKKGGGNSIESPESDR